MTIPNPSFSVTTSLDCECAPPVAVLCESCSVSACVFHSVRKKKRVSVYVCNRKVQKHSTNKLSSSTRSTIASTDTPSLICPPPPNATKCLAPSKTSDKVGSVSTLLVERLMPNGLSDAEATFLALRIHPDTGLLCYESTTPRDAKALAWLMDQGACQADIFPWNNGTQFIHFGASIKRSTVAPHVH